MLDLNAVPTPDIELDEDRLVRLSAHKLFERLNPPVRDPKIAPDAPLLPIYDWEIANDTKLRLNAVRSSLRHLDGQSVDVEIVNEEHRVTALSNH